jgi:hypothetical protein
MGDHLQSKVSQYALAGSRSLAASNSDPPSTALATLPRFGTLTRIEKHSFRRFQQNLSDFPSKQCDFQPKQCQLQSKQNGFEFKQCRFRPKQCQLQPKQNGFGFKQYRFQSKQREFQFKQNGFECQQCQLQWQHCQFEVKQRGLQMKQCRFGVEQYGFLSNPKFCLRKDSTRTHGLVEMTHFDCAQCDCLVLGSYFSEVSNTVKIRIIGIIPCSITFFVQSFSPQSQ